jgi:hypothetical protein
MQTKLVMLSHPLGSEQLSVRTGQATTVAAQAATIAATAYPAACRTKTLLWALFNLHVVLCFFAAFLLGYSVCGLL